MKKMTEQDGKSLDMVSGNLEALKAIFPEAFTEDSVDFEVLRLFFIDSVKYYRQYDEDGSEVKGKYALMFEEEYRKLARQPDYQTLKAMVVLILSRLSARMSISPKGWC